MDRLLTVDQCAELTATTPAFWRKLLYRRVIPHVKVGRLTRIRESDLEAWLRIGLQPQQQVVRSAGRPKTGSSEVVGSEAGGR